MISKGRLVFTLVSFLTVLLMAAGTMTATANRQQTDGGDSLYKYLSVFMEVFGLVTKAYVDEPETKSLMNGALEGTLDALDPFSQYIPAEDVERYGAIKEVGSSRSGVLILKEQGVAYTVAVAEGGPAEQADLAPGDILSTIEGRSTRSMPLHRIQELMAGPPGTKLSIERLRQGSKSVVEMTLAEFEPASVKLEAHKGVPVLRIPSFHDGTLENVRASLAVLTGDSKSLPGLTEVEKLVIDLRGVAGGNKSAAYATAGLFVSGTLGVLAGRTGELQTFDGEENPSWKGRLVLLVDRGTQGAAEIMVSILKQSLEATLIGEGTFGHSGRQELIPLSNGGRVRLTSAFFTGPDGKPLDTSLKADVRVRARVTGAAEVAEVAEPDDAPEPEAAIETAESDESLEILDPVLERGVDFLLEEQEVEEEELAA